MNIIIYGITKERAYEKLQTILDNLRYGDVLKVKKSKYEFEVILKDGTRYRAITASDSARGNKWQFAYIDTLIDDEVINNIVFPSFYNCEKSRLEESYLCY